MSDCSQPFCPQLLEQLWCLIVGRPFGLLAQEFLRYLTAIELVALCRNELQAPVRWQIWGYVD